MKSARQFLHHILDQVPRKRRMLMKRKQHLLDLAFPQSGTDCPVQGGTKTPQQEKYVAIIERDHIVNACERFLEPVERGLDLLDEKSRKVVEHICFDGYVPAYVANYLELEPDRLNLLYKRALDILAQEILGPYHEL